MNGKNIASRITIRRRYVRSVDLLRDVDDPDALDGYVITPSVREAAVRILAGLSPESRQRAFRVVGPYGAGKSAFGVFLAQLFRQGIRGTAMALLSEATGDSHDVGRWRPVMISGRRVSFSRELLRVLINDCERRSSTTFTRLKVRAKSLLDRDGSLDVHEVTSLLGEIAAQVRSETGEGLLLLVDEMGLLLEYAAANIDIEDPSIFQAVAERAGGRAGANLAIVGFLHRRFADFVAGMGGWIEAEWSRSSERYEELAFGGSIEQSLFMLARAIVPSQGHSNEVVRRAEDIYKEAVNRRLFVAPLEEVVEIAPCLYPLHPAAIITLSLAIRRFGQNERSLFGFLQSLEPAGLKRFSDSTAYGPDHWYMVPSVFDHLAGTFNEANLGERARRWSLAFDALAGAADLSQDYLVVLKTVALVAVLEPVPGFIANCRNIAWSLDIGEAKAQSVLDELAKRNLIYRRPHRGDYSLWSNSSVDLSHWLDEAKSKIRAPERLDHLSSVVTTNRPAVAHRHYHETGMLRTFQVQLWTGKKPGRRKTDGLILVAPVYLGDHKEKVLRDASSTVIDDPLALVCARKVIPADLKWAHELAIWRWIQDNCQELKVDELARVEVSERIAATEQALTHATALLSSASSSREETWWFGGEPIPLPPGELSGLFSDLCDKAYRHAPILKNELINRSKLSTAVASARTRLLDRMLTCVDQPQLGMEGTPPERTIYLSMFHASGIHRQDTRGNFNFIAPDSEDPCHWMPVWECIGNRLNSGEAVSFAELMDELAIPPYGLRQGPALLAITAFILASRDNIAVLERNSFQPELSAAHFMRLAKSPGNFKLKSLREDASERGIVNAMATGLRVIGKCKATVSGVSEKLYAWYNGLPSHAIKTTSVSATAVDVRAVLRKASEPGSLFFVDLPSACGAVTANGRVDVEHFIKTLNSALSELQNATPLIRSKAVTATLQAFGEPDLCALRNHIQNEFAPHRGHLTDYRLGVFLDRATNGNLSTDRWLDGLAGHLTGQRPDNWADDELDKFEFEIRVVADSLSNWLAMANTKQDRSTDLTRVHVISIDGREQAVVVRRDRPNPYLERRLTALREALGKDPNAVELLGQLLAECADAEHTHKDTAEVQIKEVDKT